METLLRPLIPLALIAAALGFVATQPHHRRCVAPAAGVMGAVLHPSQNCLQCHVGREISPGRLDSE